jgi:hypothetical protein
MVMITSEGGLVLSKLRNDPGAEWSPSSLWVIQGWARHRFDYSRSIVGRGRNSLWVGLLREEAADLALGHVLPVASRPRMRASEKTIRDELRKLLSMGGLPSEGNLRAKVPNATREQVRAALVAEGVILPKGRPKGRRPPKIAEK